MEELRRLLVARGAALAGCADLSAVPPEAREGLPRAVSIAVALAPAIVAGIAGGPTREYLEHYKARNALLDELSAAAAELLRSRGARAVALVSTNGGTVVRLPHKTAATRAGLGWIGKCALLVTESHGSAVRLTTVLTDAALEPGRPVDESRCGDCAECRKVCPGGAVRGPNWRLGMGREEIFDEASCREGIRKASAGRGLDRLVCGMCVAACPFTRRHLRRSGA
ncbi:MAG TPA: 4Fe-4S double cluster binding domain-containing protein [Planctomycetota bacterium]|nr:4Fe-4S double cluster binding domain-containing protein [Planctomycetota bacterium]